MKAKLASKWVWAFPLLAALAASGCRTMIVTTPTPDRDAYTVEARASEQMALWQVKAEAEKPLGVQIARRTVQGVQKELMEVGLQVSDRQGDVQVKFTTEAEKFDRSGNYYVYAGRANGDVRLRAGGGSPESLIGNLDAQARGERKLGEDDALASLAEALGARLSEQIINYAPAVRDQIKAESITIRLSWLQRRARSDVALAEYAALFVQTVGKMSGVLDCRLQEQDPAAGSAQFRVVYLRDAFPQGFNNALLQQPDLKLKRIR